MEAPPKSVPDLPITTTTTPTTPNPKKLTLIPLIFLIYFEVAGGPYGEEPAVQAAGPLLAILSFLIFPFIWSVPEALITAELSTTFPGNGGFVIWADRAFLGFPNGHLKVPGVTEGEGEGERGAEFLLDGEEESKPQIKA